MASPASSSADAGAAVGFAFLDARLRAHVERAAAGDPNPGDPLRGLYISDDQALALAADARADDADARLADAGARLGLDALDTAVLGLCAAPELHPRYGRLFAYLHDDVTRRLASPRLVAELLAGDGVAAVRRARLLRPRRGPAPHRRAAPGRGRRAPRRSATARSRSPTRWPPSCSGSARRSTRSAAGACGARRCPPRARAARSR